MIIDFFINIENVDEEIDWLEEELLSKKEEIKEDLIIRVYGGFEIERDDEYVYENFEIESYIDADEDEEIENEIYKILDQIYKMYEKIKKNEKFIKEFKEACS